MGKLIPFYKKSLKGGENETSSLKRNRDQKPKLEESFDSRRSTTFQKQYLIKGNREMDVKKEEKI